MFAHGFAALLKSGKVKKRGLCPPQLHLCTTQKYSSLSHVEQMKELNNKNQINTGTFIDEDKSRESREKTVHLD